MKRKSIGIVAAVVMALFGTLLLVGYVQSAHNKAAASDRLYPVLVVAKPIAKGVAASALIASVKTEQVPAGLKATGAVANLASLKDEVAATDLVPGEELVSSLFAPPQANHSTVPPDKLRVTLSLDPERSLGGQLHPGDTVAVVISFDKDQPDPATSHLILHQVEVTAVQSASSSTTSTTTKGQTNAQDQAPTVAPSGKLLVTLALDAPSVERVVFAAEHGKIWLAAEPAAASQGGTTVITKANVFQ